MKYGQFQLFLHYFKPEVKYDVFWLSVINLELTQMYSENGIPSHLIRSFESLSRFEHLEKVLQGLCFSALMSMFKSFSW